jgi:sugar phosphate isomerase/epimerase
MLTRREFGKLGLAGFIMGRPEGRPLRFDGEAAINSTVNGVHLGAQTYSFRDLPHAPGGDAIDPVIKALVECGIGEVELWASQVEPDFPSGPRGRRGDPPSPEAVKAREDIRKWRLETPLDHFAGIKKKFDVAGITIHAYNYSPNTSYTDAEIDRGFGMAKALGAPIITASTTLDVAKRIVPFADKHKMIVAMHGHSNVTDPNEFATPDSFAAAMTMSKYFKVNLDIGHFVSADFDPVSYIREHHADITNLHIKDRRKHQGDNTPWGQGDTPIREVLQLLKRERWPIPCDIEYEYRGQGTSVDEVKKCLAFAKQALA